jgi:hypothetical protein
MIFSHRRYIFSILGSLVLTFITIVLLYNGKNIVAVSLKNNVETNQCSITYENGSNKSVKIPYYRGPFPEISFHSFNVPDDFRPEAMVFNFTSAPGDQWTVREICIIKNGFFRSVLPLDQLNNGKKVNITSLKIGEDGSCLIVTGSGIPLLVPPEGGWNFSNTVFSPLKTTIVAVLIWFVFYIVCLNWIIKQCTSEQFRKDINLKAELLMFGVIGVLLVLLCRKMTNYIYGDELWFRKYVFDNFNGVLNFGIWRWRTWSSRFIIETISPIFCCPARREFFYTVNFMAMAGVVLFLRSILYYWKAFSLRPWLIILILAFPYKVVFPSGWKTGSINYLWTFAAALPIYFVSATLVNGRKVSLWFQILAILSAVIACNNEMGAVCVSVICLGASIAVFIKHKKIPYSVLFSALMGFITLFIIFSCPGNKVRKISEIKTWFPEFAQYTIVKKAELAMATTFTELISNPFFLAFILLLFITALRKIFSDNHMSKDLNLQKQKLILAFISAAPLIIMTGVIRFVTNKNISQIYIRHVITIPETSFIFYLLAGCCFLTAIAILLYICSDSIPEAICLCGLYGIGVATRMAMGLSPTIFASETRTFTYLFFIVLFLLILFTAKLLAKMPEMDNCIKLKLFLYKCTHKQRCS